MKHPGIGIRRRLAIGFGLTCLLMVALTAFTVVNARRQAVLQDLITTRVMPRSTAADELRVAALGVSVAVRSYALTPDAGRRDALRQAVAIEARAFDRLDDLPKDADGVILWREAATLRTRFSDQADLFARAVAGNVDAGLLRGMESDLGVTRDRLIQKLTEYAQLQDSKLAAAIGQMDAARAARERGTLVLSAVLLALAVLVGVGVTRSVREPALQVIRAARALERGDYGPALAFGAEVKGGARPRNEMVEIAHAMGNMAGALQRRERRLACDARLARSVARSVDPLTLACQALDTLVRDARADVGAVYALDGDTGTLRLLASHALSTLPATVAPGDGLIGEAARATEPRVIDAPEGTFHVDFGFERVPPRALALVPLRLQDAPAGVLLLGSVTGFDEDALAFVTAAAAPLAVALSNAASHARAQRLADDLGDRNDELAAQNEELQAQAEEIQVQNEELQAQADEIRSQNEDLVERSDVLADRQHVIQELSATVQRQNEDLVLRNRDLLLAAREKDEFLALLSHELRNPLAAMRNAAAVLRTSPELRGGDRRAVDVLERQIRHQARLVDDLLDASRLTLGKIVLRREPVDLARVVSNVVDEQRALFTDKSLALELERDHEAWVTGDHVRLEQVVGNLLTNALKFTPSGGRVTVRLRATGEPARAVVSVEDTGIGIDPDALPRIWAPLFQADTSLDRARGGLGLGLSLVKGIVEQLGGEVAAESDGVGRGARFSFSMPLAPAPETADEVRAAQRARRSPTQVLIIEDHDDGAETICWLLESWGHRGAIATTGPDGIEAARRLRPDLVLCDIGLPGIDGFEVARTLRADPLTAEIPLVAITGYGSAADRARCEETGFERVLVKPVAIEDLERTVSELGARSRRPEVLGESS